MPEYDELETRIIGNWKKQDIAAATYRARQQIYKIIYEHKYGLGARDPHMILDWERIYNENQCPECSDLLSLTGDVYFCPTCGLAIPATLYTKGIDEHKEETALRKEEDALMEEAKAAKYTPRRLNILRKEADDEADKELEEKELENARKASPARGGGMLKAAMKPKGEENAKK